MYIIQYELLPRDEQEKPELVPDSTAIEEDEYFKKESQMDPNNDSSAADPCGFVHSTILHAATPIVLPVIAVLQLAHLRLLPLEKSCSQYTQSCQYTGINTQVAHESWIRNLFFLRLGSTCFIHSDFIAYELSHVFVNQNA